MRVLRFDAGSLATPDRLAQVLRIVDVERSDGSIHVVVPAIGDTTDLLLDVAELAGRGAIANARLIVERLAEEAKAVTIAAVARLGREATTRGTSLYRDLIAILVRIANVEERTPGDRDHVVSFGERVSSALVAEALVAIGLDAIQVDPRTWCVTDRTFGDARVDWPRTRSNLQAIGMALLPGFVPVHGGGVGKTLDGETTTLGRKGCDYTAALLGRAFNAAEVDLFGEEPGITTTDGRVIARLAYDEARGLRMLHPRTLEPLVEANVPLRIRATMEPGACGTLIDRVGDDGRAPDHSMPR